jgi:hypothetical protein
MFNKAFAAAALALTASRLAAAQTFSECNPMEKSTSTRSIGSPCGTTVANMMTSLPSR